MKKLLMGNEALAHGAIRAGVNFVCGYPGTPSSEVLETIAKNNLDKSIHVEWSINEKVAMENGAGAAMAGSRVLVTMKQVGLNVAADPLMCLTHLSIKGGMVVLVADDPGPISSQTEQDTRHFAKYANLPVFDPITPEMAYEMMPYAFALSEQFELPVIMRPTTRLSHGCASVDLVDEKIAHKVEGFTHSPKWAIFPGVAYRNHISLEQKQKEISDIFSELPFNTISQAGEIHIVTGGTPALAVEEILDELGVEAKIMKVGTPFPFPEKLALEFLQTANEVLVIEELDGVIEEALVNICGKHHLDINILGKETASLPYAGEYSYSLIKKAILNFMEESEEVIEPKTMPLPVRPPSLCAGCPHRASFYAVKTAMRGQKTVFTGDIGCYTLGNAAPLNMVDTCLCMGAGINMAQGIYHTEPDTKAFAFIGDSTFFHSGITGVINAIYNQANINVVILDNRTTAMTGHQPHPGTGVTMMGNPTDKINIPRVLEGIGVPFIREVNPLDLAASQEVIREAADFNGVSVIIFEAPCVALFKPNMVAKVTEDCINCGKCARDLGCSAIEKIDGKICINESLCYGCNLCAQVCKFDGIVLEAK